MPRKKKPEPEMKPGELREFIRAGVTRARKVWDLDYLLTRAAEHAERVIGRNKGNTDANHILTLARNILEWRAALQTAIAASEERPPDIAVLALKLGAAARELELWDRLFDNWPTPTETARILGRDTPEVSKLIAAGKLKTNGGRGKPHVRVNPMSILLRLVETGALADPNPETISERSREIRENWTQQELGQRKADYDSLADKFVSPDDNA